MISTRDWLALSLLDVLRAHLLASRFTLSAGATSVSTTNTYILWELQLHPAINIPQLAAMLCLNKSSISRGLKQLLSDGYLRLNSVGASRARRKRYELSAKAERFLTQQEEENNQFVAQHALNLNASELEQLAAFLLAFADGSGAPEGLSAADPKHIHERIRRAFRRLTRAHGVTSGNYLGSAQGVSEWVVFSEIQYAGRRPHALAKLLHTPANAISQILRRYKRLRLIDFGADANDKRQNKLLLTAAGLAALQSIERCALQQFNTALADLEDQQYASFVQLLARYVGPGAKPRAALFDNDLVVRPLQTEEELLGARWLLVKELQEKSPAEYALSSSIFAKHNHSFAAFCGEEMVCACEFSGPAHAPVLLNYCGASGAETRTRLLQAAQNLLT